MGLAHSLGKGNMLILLTTATSETHTDGIKGLIKANKSKLFPFGFSIINAIEKSMYGFVNSTTCCLEEVIVIGAAAMSAF